MLFQVAGGGSRPTFFEMVAADQLPVSIKHGLFYALEVFAPRHPFLYRLLDYRNEAFALLMLLFEGQCLHTHNASFSENLYGLRRQSTRIPPTSAMSAMAVSSPSLQHDAHHHQQQHKHRSPASHPPSMSMSASGYTANKGRLENNPSTSGKHWQPHGEGGGGSLTRQQRILALVFLVGIPYLKAKAQQYHALRRSRLLRSMLLDGGSDSEAAAIGVEEDRDGDDDDGEEEEDDDDDDDEDEDDETESEIERSATSEEDSLSNGSFNNEEVIGGGDSGVWGRRRGGRRRGRGPGNSSTGRSSRSRNVLRVVAVRLRRAIKSILGRVYPAVHVCTESLCFGYVVCYILEMTRYYSPWLHLQGVVVRRITGEEMDAAAAGNRSRAMAADDRVVRTSHASSSVRIWSNLSLAAIRKMISRLILATLDYAQTGLIGAVFAFKVLEWWYRTAEQNMAVPKVFPPPPPPPPPRKFAGGQEEAESVGLPEDRQLCPLCMQMRTNPTLVPSSGFVFCYPCIYRYVSQHCRCPVTFMPATIEELRRLYHAS
ncbi:hypothetical protein CBR_g51833 [Chara braunii]|uniref:Peroxin-12 n=1 Tax=Chara braunii TaxID=69332 RepID=A0A388M9G7_CHABU|nr:hypothetical protein CBR_g51833 [Chara braunii]|eukprot:GBG91099.1 hypothetical protein CBR_g51833 [Chara braunii]